jgi:hypothetical protein
MEGKMERIEVKTQEEFDAAVKAGNTAICIYGFFVARDSSHVEALGSSHVVAWGSSHVEARDSAHVEACGSSYVVARDSAHVFARDSSHVEARDSAHVEARGSAHVEAWGSSHVVALGSSHVVARGNVFVRLFSCLKIEAGIHVLIMDHGKNKKKISGGNIFNAFKPKTPLQWCKHWGVKVEKKVAILFKGVNKKYMSDRGGNYTPATIPVAHDWDGGEQECGKGLHFSPTPLMTHDFCSPEKYIACPVALKDISVHPDGAYPQKVKAKGCCAKVWEVDENGNKI